VTSRTTGSTASGIFAMHQPLPFVAQAPHGVENWMRMFSARELPVLASTAQALEALRPKVETVDAHRLAEAIEGDPLMTVKLLSHIAQLRKGRKSNRLGSDTETVTETLVMLGIPPFFRAFGPQVAAEDVLYDHPAALDGFKRVLRRSRRAARFALAFAVHRMDHDATVIHEAALLRDFAELLLWLRAPALALQLAQRLAGDPALRSVKAQHDLLQVGLDELAHALMVAWGLPALLVQITEEKTENVTAAMRNVQLAVRVARHSSEGWSNPALPDDYRDIGHLLNLAPDHVNRLVLDIDKG
jgi:HD-like signal output (HDOD) protein